jgi:hypothetical protein
VVTNLPAHTRERIDELRTFHRPGTQRWWEKLLARPVRCVMCGQRWMCRDRRWAEDVADGRRPAAGWAA